MYRFPCLPYYRYRISLQTSNRSRTTAQRIILRMQLVLTIPRILRMRLEQTARTLRIIPEITILRMQTDRITARTAQAMTTITDKNDNL